MRHTNKIPMKEIRNIAERIAANFDVSKIILFGSYAHGMPDEASDVDFLVVVDSPKRDWKVGYNIYRSLSPHPFPMDVVVRTKREIRERIPLGDWFLKDIVNKGIVLYESSR